MTNAIKVIFSYAIKIEILKLQYATSPEDLIELWVYRPFSVQEYCID